MFLPLALDGGEWSVACPDCFTPRERTNYLLDRRLSTPQNQSRCTGEEKNLCSWQESNLSSLVIHTVHSLVTILTELF
jgi:hypothetical protein